MINLDNIVNNNNRKHNEKGHIFQIILIEFLKYEHLIKNRENAEIKHLNDSKYLLNV